MSTGLITNTLLSATETPLPGVSVVATLLPNDPGWSAAGEVTSSKTMTNTAGVWSLTLSRTDLMVPEGPWQYQVVESLPGGPVLAPLLRVYRIIVPGPGPYTVDEVWVPSTAPGGPFGPGIYDESVFDAAAYWLELNAGSQNWVAPALQSVGSITAIRVVPARTNRWGADVANRHTSATLWIGPTAAVAVGAGWPIGPGRDYPLRTQADIWAIADSGSIDVATLEVF